MKTLILLTIATSTFFLPYHEQEVVAEIGPSKFILLPNIKSDAFNVLNAKCNVCHRTKNPWKMFTPENMNAFAPKIYKQVFIKKRMPKGNQFRLSQGDYNTLNKWLSRLNIN